jgi:hypothetical protein
MVVVSAEVLYYDIVECMVDTVVVVDTPVAAKLVAVDIV